MKKRLVSLILLSFVLINSLIYANAQGTIVEVPQIKIAINGQIKQLQDVPIIINGRTLIPLRTLLNNLGVPNEEKYISWNAKERSVTVNSGNANIYLRIDNKTVYVNKKALDLDVVPIIYKNRTYIPVRFVSQSLNKKVNWDGELSYITIADTDKFDEAKAVLDKADSLMRNLKSMKYTVNISSTVTNSLDGSWTHSGSSTSEYTVDFGHKAAYVKETTNEPDGSPKIQESYVVNGMEYKKAAGTNTWDKVVYPAEQFLEDFVPVMNSDNALCYGVSESSDSTTDIDRLRGSGFAAILVDTFIHALRPETGDISTSLKTSDTLVELDRKTGYMNKVETNLSINLRHQGMDFPMNIHMSVLFSDFDSNIRISLPGSLMLSQAPVNELGSWSAKTGAPTAREEVASAVLNGKIYVLGGGNIGDASSKLEVYDPASDSWKSKASLPRDGNRTAIAAVNGKIYAIGGSYSKELWEYNPDTDVWTRKKDMLYNRAYASAAVCQGRIYVSGGLYNYKQATMEMYDPVSDQWVEKNSMLNSRFAHNMVVVNGRMLVLGGYSTGSSIESYDFSTDSWQSLPDAPFDFYSAGAVVIDNKVYIVGGSSESNRLVEYDPDKDTWISKAAMPTNRERLSATIFDGKIYAVDGVHHPGGLLNTLEVYTP